MFKFIKEKATNTKDLLVCKSVLWAVKKEAETCEKQPNKTEAECKECENTQSAVRILSMFCSMVGEKDEEKAKLASKIILNELEQLDKNEATLIHKPRK